MTLHRLRSADDDEAPRDSDPASGRPEFPAMSPRLSAPPSQESLRFASPSVVQTLETWKVDGSGYQVLLNSSHVLNFFLSIVEILGRIKSRKNLLARFDNSSKLWNRRANERKNEKWVPLVRISTLRNWIPLPPQLTVDTALTVPRALPLCVPARAYCLAIVISIARLPLRFSVPSLEESPPPLSSVAPLDLQRLFLGE